MKKRGCLGLLTLCLFLLGPLACTGDEASCVDLCEEAQANDCTSIKGDCSAFCEAAFNVEDDSGCAAEREDYQTCLELQDVCDNSCDGKENTYSECLGSYCLTDTSSPDCQTLLNSF